MLGICPPSEGRLAVDGVEAAPTLRLQTRCHPGGYLAARCLVAWPARLTARPSIQVVAQPSATPSIRLVPSHRVPLAPQPSVCLVPQLSIPLVPKPSAGPSIWPAPQLSIPLVPEPLAGPSVWLMPQLSIPLVPKPSAGPRYGRCRSCRYRWYQSRRRGRRYGRRHSCRYAGTKALGAATDMAGDDSCRYTAGAAAVDTVGAARPARFVPRLSVNWICAHAGASAWLAVARARHASLLFGSAALPCRVSRPGDKAPHAHGTPAKQKLRRLPIGSAVPIGLSFKIERQVFLASPIRQRSPTRGLRLPCHLLAQSSGGARRCGC